MTLLQNKRAQGEIITTVLLILVGIAAIALVSTFVINMVRDNLKSTDCFKTTGQLKINTDDGFTWANSTQVSVSIERGEKDFNLTGISVSLGNGAESKAYIIKIGATIAKMYNNASAPVSLPSPSETKTYLIDTTGGITGINQVKAVPIIYPEQRCNEGSAESTIPSKT